MKINLNWLKDYVSYGISTETLIHKLTMAGLEVEKEETVGGERVIEMEITPNRPDCLNILGVAREVSAILNKPLKKPAIKKFKIPKKKTEISIEDKKDCRRYIGAVVEGVSVAAAEAQLKKRIESLGIRAVNNIVDITNFCLMELGQPLHAFDYDKLEGGKIIVRRAKKGEKIVAIDGNTYELDPSILVIADARKPVAIAGVMGGQETEVTASTKNILLESAYFAPALIRRASRKLKLASDSSYRFERGIDINMVEGCAARATDLILQQAGGRVIAHADKYPGKISKKGTPIRIRQDEINSLLGASIPAAKSKTILKKLEFLVASSKTGLRVTAPSFRGDIKEKVDLIEEVARIVGYDNLPETIPSVNVQNIPENGYKKFKDFLREAAVGYGFDETVTFTMTNQGALERCGLADRKSLRIQNPLTVDQELLRPSALSSMLNVLMTNVNRGRKNLRLFEIGKIFNPDGTENERLILALTGTRLDDWRKTNNEAADLFDLKGVVEELLKQTGNGQVKFTEMSGGQAPYQAGQAARIQSDEKEIGSLGAVSRDILERWDLKVDRLYFAEIDVSWLYERGRPAGVFKPITEFPAVVRDISVAVKSEVSYRQILEVIVSQKAETLKDVRLLEQYIGEKLPAGHRGLVLSLTYQSRSRTLREEEVHRAHEQICQALTDELGAVRR